MPWFKCKSGFTKKWAEIEAKTAKEAATIYAEWLNLPVIVKVQKHGKYQIYLEKTFIAEKIEGN